MSNSPNLAMPVDTDFPSPSTRFDVAIIGGGVVGLATAMALAREHGASVIVLEAEGRLAAHQTGNNSGVIHAGLYYKPGSLKATLCSEGREEMFRFCAEHGVDHERTGKLVVAIDQDEMPALQTLLERGTANGLRDLRILSVEELREHEPNVAGIAGLYVKETGIANYKQVTASYAQIVREHGGQVHIQAQVTGVTHRPDAITLHTTKGDVEARNLVNCGGLQCDRVARMCGVEPAVKIIPFRGEYYQLKREAWHLVRNLIYPVPNPAFPFLGVHFTRMASGGVEAGPNAVLALARHGYSWKHINLKDMFETLTFPGFWKMSKYWKTGFGEMKRSLSKTAFHKALSRLMPSLKIDDLERGGAGVRAQAMDRDGKMVDDFAIQTTQRMVHVLNAPSPAATASISIGRRIAATPSLQENLSSMAKVAV